MQYETFLDDVLFAMDEDTPLYDSLKKELCNWVDSVNENLDPSVVTVLDIGNDSYIFIVEEDHAFSAYRFFVGKDEYVVSADRVGVKLYDMMQYIFEAKTKYVI